MNLLSLVTGNKEEVVHLGQFQRVPSPEVSTETAILGDSSFPWRLQALDDSGGPRLPSAASQGWSPPPLATPEVSLIDHPTTSQPLSLLTTSLSRMGDHTECVRLVYDPEVISYTGLLGVFWRSHDSSARVTM